MPRVGLSLSYPSPPDDPTDQVRIEKYLAAIAAGGAEPVPLFLNEWETKLSQAASLDGLVLAGGADLDPAWYQEAPIPEAGLDMVSDRRPEFEQKVVRAFLERQKPVLGICYGCQFLNVFHGGALYQDLELQVPDVIEHKNGALHEVTLDEESFLYQLLEHSGFEVPSYHHQAISRVAPGARVSSLAPDFVIESIEWPEFGFHLGVQWHPERAPDSLATKRLFAAFAAACGR
jgi:putative glutamine amidotransferase